MIQRTVERMYDETEENRFLEVTYANGDKEVLYFKDFNSGAMIQNIVDRAKKAAIKSVLETGQPGLRVQHLLDAIVDEFAENEDLPNTTNPDDWARISGKKGERIVYIRTLVSGKNAEWGGRSTPRPTPASTCSPARPGGPAPSEGPGRRRVVRERRRGCSESGFQCVECTERRFRYMGASQDQPSARSAAVPTCATRNIAVGSHLRLMSRRRARSPGV